MWAYGGVHSMLSDLSWRRVWSLLELTSSACVPIDLGQRLVG